MDNISSAEMLNIDLLTHASDESLHLPITGDLVLESDTDDRKVNVKSVKSAQLVLEANSANSAVPSSVPSVVMWQKNKTSAAKLAMSNTEDVELSAHGSGDLVFTVGGGVTSGNLTSGSEYLRLKYGGNIEASKGLLLPSTGGTPSLLDFYEKYDGTLSWSGPFASPVTASVRVVRIGNFISCWFDEAIGDHVSNNFVSSTALPQRFRPSHNQLQVGSVLHGNYKGLGLIIFYASGVIRAFSDSSGSVFTKSSNCGIKSATYCYTL